MWSRLRTSLDKRSGTGTKVRLRPELPYGLKILHSPESNTGVVDIIFIHGLSGHREKTWACKDAVAPWPQTLLPFRVPEARILVFGYDSKVADWKHVVSQSRIANHAWNLLVAVAAQREEDRSSGQNDRAILFVCHSLGGLVCKDALVIANSREEPRFREIFMLTRGVMFLGTPHTGSNLASWGEILAKSVGTIKQANRDIVRVLKQGSEVLVRIHDSFSNLITIRNKERGHAIHITCFFEELPLPAIGLVVPQQSAILPGHVQIGIHANHMDMARFSDASDPGFRAICGEIRQWMNLIVDTTAVSHEPFESVGDANTAKELDTTAFDDGSTYIPVKHSSPHFTGQEMYINALVAYFQPRSERDLPARREYLLHGIGGVGKTQICLKFAEQHSRLFWRVYWVDATNKETLELSFRDIGTDPAAVEAGVDLKSTDTITKWLSRLRQEWLLVLDNADWDHDLLDSFIPSGARANILINSRNPSLRHRVPVHAAMEVVGMSLNDAKSVLSKVSHLDDESAAEFDTELDSIATELHAIPLALDHAGSAILCGFCDLHDYRAMLRKHRKKLLANSQFRGAPGYSQTLYSTWSLTTTLLEDRAHASSLDTSPEAAAIQLLNLFGFFHHSSIMEDTFRRAAEAKDEVLNTITPMIESLPRTTAYLPEFLLSVGEDGIWDPLVFREAIRILNSASLIRRDKRRASYSIHPLVHLWSRERLTVHEQTKSYLAVQAVLSISIGDDHPRHDVFYCRQLTPHLVAVQNAANELRLPDSYFDDSAKSFWHTFFDNGLIGEAEAYAARMKGQRTQLLGPKHQLTLGAAESLAITLRETSVKEKVEDSQTLHEETHRLRVEGFGNSHPDTLRSKVILGTIYQYNGRFRHARTILEAAWETARSSLGEAHDFTTSAASQLSSVYSELGLDGEAEEIQRRLLAIAKDAFGAGDLRTISAMAFLAVTLTKRGKLDESEVLKREIAEKRTECLGEDHNDTLMAWTNLAATYSHQGKWKDAEKICGEVIRRRTALAGNLHRETLRTRLILTDCYIGQSRLQEAESEILQVVDGRKVTLGDDHAHTLWSMHILAGILEKLDRIPEAIELWGKTILMQLGNPDLGMDHWETKLVAERIAAAHQKLNLKKSGLVQVSTALTQG